MKRFLKLYSIEQKLFFRTPDAFLFGICMPLVALILIVVIAGWKTAGNTDMTYLETSFVALSAVGICCYAFMSIPIVLVDYRDKKILKHLYCSPCSPFKLLMADVMCSGIMSVISVIILTLVACLGFGYRMSGNVFAYIGCWFLTLVSMFSIGLLIASLCKTSKSMGIVTTIVYFPMLLFSGTSIPYEVLPGGMQKIANVLPLGVGIRLMKAVSSSAGIAGHVHELIILVVIAAVCGGIAVKTFKWE